jgi:hypothetical protein
VVFNKVIKTMTIKHIQSNEEFLDDEDEQLIPDETNDYDADHDSLDETLLSKSCQLANKHHFNPSFKDFLKIKSFRATRNVDLTKSKLNKSYIQLFVDTEYENDRGISIQCIYVAASAASSYASW